MASPQSGPGDPRLSGGVGDDGAPPVSPPNDLGVAARREPPASVGARLRAGASGMSALPGALPQWRFGLLRQVEAGGRYGFIVPEGGGPEWFALPTPEGFPPSGSRVAFRLVVDRKFGNLRAEGVRCCRATGAQEQVTRGDVRGPSSARLPGSRLAPCGRPALVAPGLECQRANEREGRRRWQAQEIAPLVVQEVVLAAAIRSLAAEAHGAVGQYQRRRVCVLLQSHPVGLYMQGNRVRTAFPGHCAFQAGVRAGMVLTDVNGQKVPSWFAQHALPFLEVPAALGFGWPEPSPEERAALLGGSAPQRGLVVGDVVYMLKANHRVVAHGACGVVTAVDKLAVEVEFEGRRSWYAVPWLTREPPLRGDLEDEGAWPLTSPPKAPPPPLWPLPGCATSWVRWP